jgi:hypothetical protein
MTTNHAPEVFIHIPKTAGSSLRTVLREVYGDDECYLYSPMRALLAMDRSEKRRLDCGLMQWCNENKSRERRAAIYGHMFYGVCRGWTRQSRYMTILREPVARVLSNYYFRRQHGHCDEPAVDLTSFARGNSPNLAMQLEADNLQARFLGALDGSADPLAFGACDNGFVDRALQRIQSGELLVGFADCPSQAMEHFARGLNWGRIPVLGRERITRVYPAIWEHSQELIEKIANQNKYDEMLWRGARQLMTNANLAS